MNSWSLSLLPPSGHNAFLLRHKHLPGSFRLSLITTHMLECELMTPITHMSSTPLILAGQYHLYLQIPDSMTWAHDVAALVLVQFWLLAVMSKIARSAKASRLDMTGLVGNIADYNVDYELWLLCHTWLPSSGTPAWFFWGVTAQKLLRTTGLHNFAHVVYQGQQRVTSFISASLCPSLFLSIKFSSCPRPLRLFISIF